VNTQKTLACSLQSNVDTNNQTLTTGHIASTSSQSTLAVATETLSAEVLWALRVCTSHQSYRSVNDIGKLFAQMFPDIVIATSFSMGESKCAYVIKFGLAPYFKHILLDRIKGNGNFVIMFDESLN